jgi:hypothetical protein
MRGVSKCEKHGGLREYATQRFAEMLPGAIAKLDELSAQRAHLPTSLRATTAIIDRVVGPVAGERQPGSSAPQIVLGVQVLLPSTQPDSITQAITAGATDAEIVEIPKENSEV